MIPSPCSCAHIGTAQYFSCLQFVGFGTTQPILKHHRWFALTQLDEKKMQGCHDLNGVHGEPLPWIYGTIACSWFNFGHAYMLHHTRIYIYNTKTIHWWFTGYVPNMIWFCFAVSPSLHPFCWWDTVVKKESQTNGPWYSEVIQVDRNLSWRLVVSTISPLHLSYLSLFGIF